jgi:hypothetical protein
MKTTTDNDRAREMGIHPRAIFSLFILSVALLGYAILCLFRGENPFPFALVPVLIILPVLWIGAEVNQRSKVWRIIFGVGTMATIGVVVHQASMFVPKYERGYHRQAMEDIQKLLSQGRMAEVSEAVALYNRIAQKEGNSFAAASALRQYLEEIQKERSEQGN